MGGGILAASSPAAELLPPHPALCLLQREGGIFGKRHLCIFPDSAKSQEKGLEFLPSRSATAAARITHPKSAQTNLPRPGEIPGAPFLCFVPFAEIYRPNSLSANPNQSSGEGEKVPPSTPPPTIPVFLLITATIKPSGDY